MKFTIISASTALVAALFSGMASAAPVEKRDGPSGQIFFESTTMTMYDGLHFQYKPVEQLAGGSGQVTTGLIVNLAQGNKIVPLGTYQLASPNYEQGPYHIGFDMHNMRRQGFSCGQWNVQVTEVQQGPVFTGTFLAYAPTVEFTGC